MSPAAGSVGPSLRSLIFTDLGYMVILLFWCWVDLGASCVFIAVHGETSLAGPSSSVIADKSVKYNCPNSNFWTQGPLVSMISFLT